MTIKNFWVLLLVVVGLSMKQKFFSSVKNLITIKKHIAIGCLKLGCTRFVHFHLLPLFYTSLQNICIRSISFWITLWPKNTPHPPPHPPQKKITFGNFQNVWASLGTSAGHSQPTIPVLDAIFPWLLSLCRKSKTLVPFRNIDNQTIL